jgi:hypothetical protein
VVENLLNRLLDLWTSFLRSVLLLLFNSCTDKSIYTRLEPMQGRLIYGREERRGEDLSYNKEIDAFFL